MDRGIFSTIYAMPRRPLSEAQLLELYRAYYAQAPVRPRGRATCRRPRTCAGTNFLDVTVRVVRDRIVVLACEDNLVRGTAAWRCRTSTACTASTNARRYDLGGPLILSE